MSDSYPTAYVPRKVDAYPTPKQPSYEEALNIHLDQEEEDLFPVHRVGSPNQKVKSDGWATSYYELPEGCLAIQDLIEHKSMNFAVGNIFKASYRLGQKEGQDRESDLRKIIWFAERELERLKTDG
jgi:hypothetical protein